MSAQVATTTVTPMRTAQILLGLIIAPAKKDLLGMDTYAQVKKLSTWFLFPQKFTEGDHIHGIFHQVELHIFFFWHYCCLHIPISLYNFSKLYNDSCNMYKEVSDANRRSSYIILLSGPASCDSQLTDWF